MELKAGRWTFALALLTRFTFTSALTPVQYCWYSCEAALYQIAFDGPYDECTNHLYYESQFACAATYCNHQETRAGYKYANTYCISVGTPFPAFDSVIPAALDEVKMVNLSIYSTTEPITYPVLLDQYFFDLGHRTVTVFNWNIVLATDFAYSFFGFWGLVVLVGVVNRVFDLIKQRRHTPGDAQSKSSSTWLWIRRHLVLPATVGQHCQESIGGCAIPPRLESILLLIYIALNFVYCFPGYVLFEPNLYYDQNRLQLARYVADRTGILSIANVPILWLFATRNDPLLWLTGWSFAMFNRFHRWVARIATVEAIVHSIGYTVFDFYYGGAANFYADWNYQYWYSGEIATIVMSLMLVLSIYILRERLYDLFLCIHVVFAIVFIVTMYYHIEIFGDEYKPYIWSCVAIWSFDRALRIARVVIGSILPRFTKGTRALATCDGPADMIRLDITDFIPDKPIVPGLFYYVYVPKALRGYESHPFTLCSWRAKQPGSSPGSSSPSIADEKKGFSADDKAVVASATPSESDREIRHTFLVRPYDGFTGRLKNRIMGSLESQASTQMSILLEGPYGEKLDLQRFSDVLVLAGGSGITAAVSHAHYLLEKGNTSVHIVWATKQKQLVEDICQHELAAVVGNERLNMVVYLTGAGVLEGIDDPSLPVPYTVHLGRPDFFAAMVDVRRKSSRDLAVVSCGTPRMADVTRKAFVDMLAEDGPHVEYFNETMLW